MYDSAHLILGFLKILRTYHYILLLIIYCLTVATHAAEASSICNPHQSPRVNIKTSTNNITYNFTQSMKQLDTQSIDTVNPYGNDVITDVGGLMRGTIKVSEHMLYDAVSNSYTGEICYWYTDITVVIHISPTIFVAKDFPKGSCMHNAILAHEHQHVIIDRQIVNKYAQIIGAALRQELQKQPTYGPYSISQQAAVEAGLKTSIANFIQKFADQMNAERQQRQQALDNINEYERVNHLCPRNKQ